MATVEMKLKSKPTPFFRFLSKHWPLGLLVWPFLRFLPVSWLVTIDTEVVPNG